MRAIGPLTILLLLTGGIGLSGCIETPAGDIDPASTLAGTLDFLVADHDHLDPLLHEGALNLEQLAYDPLQLGGDTPRTFGELDIVGDIAVVAVLEPTGGFVVVDIADPAAPKPIGWYEGGAAYAADVKLSPDGHLAFFAVNALFAAGEVQKDPRLAPTGAKAAGVHVVSMHDPANPVQESFYPLPTGGVHMLDVHVIDGETYVFNIQSSRTGVPALLPVPMPQMTSFVEIAKVTHLPDDSHALEPVSTYAAPEAKQAVGYIGPHDITVIDDPELGKLMLCACGRAGATVVDVNDPANPVHLGTWADHDGLYVHTVMMTYVEGQRVLVAIPETFAAEHQQPMWVIDAADPAAMETLGVWQLPGDHLPYDGGYKFSTHNINILDNKVYMAHFHAGVWVLDIGTSEKLAQPEVVAYFMPREEGNVGPSLGIAAIPLVWDVVPAKGKVFVADITTGFYVLEPGFEMPDGLAYGTRGLDA